MASFLKLFVTFVAGLCCAGMLHAQTSPADTSAAGNSLANLPGSSAGISTNGPSQYSDANPDPVNASVLRDASKLSSEKKFPEALAKLDTFFKVYPNSVYAHSLRGYIYSQQQKWDLAEKEFESMLVIDSKNSTAKFNLSELKFMQKRYDDARPGFLSLEKDDQLSDLASYKVFLCDMLAGHTHIAQQELNVFNDAGGNPSYYIGNAAWALYNKQTETARDWLQRAIRIYYPYKIQTYVSSLEELGYLPLPPPPGANASTLGGGADTNAASATSPATNSAPTITPPAPAPSP